MKLLHLAACTIATFALLGASAAATADPLTSLSSRVAEILQEFPGGIEVAPGVIEWQKGAVTLTLESEFSARSIGTCSTGQYCAWSNTLYSGTKLAFTSCSVGGTSSSLAPLGGLVRSTANARTSGTVNAVNGATVVYTMAANTGKPSNAATLTDLVCFS
ncbi:MAG: peptidase inhibitor family I36 protein [Pseudolysinimonas sp.]|uniref:peptidase inhibitor family I36 protein n=1 Tax=Pseudolysinimonas sp. TaxID=2680009 RepID=UPI003267EFF8